MEMDSLLFNKQSKANQQRITELQKKLAIRISKVGESKTVPPKTEYWKHDAVRYDSGWFGIFRAGLREGDGTRIVTSKDTFNNWGRLVQFKPYITYQPRTIVGVQNIMKWAVSHHKRVRVGGYRHSWGDIFGDAGSIMLSLLPIDVVEELPADHPGPETGNQFQFIRLVGSEYQDPSGQIHRNCEMGAATTLYQVRDWSSKNDYCLPFSVIMTEVTIGGALSVPCHGAGINHTTLSDLVVGMKFVNVNGEVQQVTDKEQLRAASGCLGLLGVVISFTIRLDKMSYAQFDMEKVPLGCCLPPPANMKLPEVLDELLYDEDSGCSRSAAEKDMNAFISKAAGSYYSEFFWFPSTGKAWTNCWNTTTDSTGTVDYPGANREQINQLEATVIEGLTDTALEFLTNRGMANLVGNAALTLMPPTVFDDGKAKTRVSNANHFRGGIQNHRVLDFEIEIPIPLKDDGSLDWGIVRNAWWIPIVDYYEHPNSPLRTALEMRITAGSNVFLAPQYGNVATCSIEVLSDVQVDIHQWHACTQRLLNKWAALTDSNGELLNVRPHPAKEWQGMKMHGKDIAEHLRQTSKHEIEMFKEQIAAIASEGGYTIQQTKATCSNKLLDYMLFGEGTAPPLPKRINHDSTCYRWVSCITCGCCF